MELGKRYRNLQDDILQETKRLYEQKWETLIKETAEKHRDPKAFWEIIKRLMDTNPGPEFEPAPVGLNVTTFAGQISRLPCSVRHLNGKTVSWIRGRDLQVLSSDRHTFSTDLRISVLPGPSRKSAIDRHWKPKKALKKKVDFKGARHRRSLTQSRVDVYTSDVGTKKNGDGGLRIVDREKMPKIGHHSLASRNTLTRSLEETSETGYRYKTQNHIDESKHHQVDYYRSRALTKEHRYDRGMMRIAKENEMSINKHNSLITNDIKIPGNSSCGSHHEVNGNFLVRKNPQMLRTSEPRTATIRRRRWTRESHLKQENSHVSEPPTRTREPWPENQSESLDNSQVEFSRTSYHLHHQLHNIPQDYEPLHHHPQQHHHHQHYQQHQHRPQHQHKNKVYYFQDNSQEEDDEDTSWNDDHRTRSQESSVISGHHPKLVADWSYVDNEKGLPANQTGDLVVEAAPPAHRTFLQVSKKTFPFGEGSNSDPTVRQPKNLPSTSPPLPLRPPRTINEPLLTRGLTVKAKSHSKRSSSKKSSSEQTPPAKSSYSFSPKYSLKSKPSPSFSGSSYSNSNDLTLDWRADDFTLQIRYTEPEDAGTYICQVNTEPSMVQVVRLNVIDMVAEIVGKQELFVKAGTPVALTCRVRHGDLMPGFIFWYKGKNLVDYASTGGRIQVLTKPEGQSQLVLQNAVPSDSANYTCYPPGGTSASVQLGVIVDERQAAMQQGSGGSTTFITNTNTETDDDSNSYVTSSAGNLGRNLAWPVGNATMFLFVLSFLYKGDFLDLLLGETVSRVALTLSAGLALLSLINYGPDVLIMTPGLVILATAFLLQWWWWYPGHEASKGGGGGGGRGGRRRREGKHDGHLLQSLKVQNSRLQPKNLKQGKVLWSQNEESNDFGNPKLLDSKNSREPLTPGDVQKTRPPPGLEAQPIRKVKEDYRSFSRLKDDEERCQECQKSLPANLPSSSLPMRTQKLSE
ncbi:uncharacterized protein LOC143040506 [Oratosquilla oratoria]|uniref:uncharacterized protein LOC143040506 n=1 Tax=Oratosquilla oratoria TaxID=337810 RepID=UPI003F75E465